MTNLPAPPVSPAALHFIPTVLPMPRPVWFWPLVVFVPACSGPNPAAPPPDASEGLKELGEVYKYRATQRMPAPSRTADFAEQQASLGNAWPLIEDGTLVILWRAGGYSAHSTDVLAYEKDAPVSGGKVLLRNGTIKQMTAEEFRATKR